MRRTISFCGACMGRRHHLEHTLPNNLVVTASFGDDVELVLVDYNSNDGLREWVLSSCAEALESGRLRYFRTDEPTSYSHAHAKNVSHRLARNDLVFNLDADNFVGDGTCQRIDELFAENPRRIVRGGLGGRVCLRRSDFVDELGGYDERFTSWGLEDDDLVRRAMRLGLERASIEGLGHVIRHGGDERFANMAVPQIPELEQTIAGLPKRLRDNARVLLARDPRQGLSFVHNARLFVENEQQGRIRAAAAGEFGRARLVDHRGNETIL